MRYDEVLFILAEATYRGMLRGGEIEAQKYYEQAIVMTREHHNLQASCKTSENVVAKAIQHMK